MFKKNGGRRSAIYEIPFCHPTLSVEALITETRRQEELRHLDNKETIFLPGLGMFSLLFRRRLDFDEASRQRRDITPLELEMYKRAIRRELQDKRKHAATCATLVCILVCGSLLVGLGTALTCSGIFVPNLKGNPTPWLVTGPTCIVIGVLVLLLSVEIIIKKKKVAIDDLATSRSGKKSTMDTTVKVKALPIWRGMDKAKSSTGQGTLPPPGGLSEEAVLEEETIVAEFPSQSSSSYSNSSTATTSSTGSPLASRKPEASLTPLESARERSVSLMLLDPSKLDRPIKAHRSPVTSEFDGHTSTSELLSSCPSTSSSLETRESVL